MQKKPRFSLIGVPFNSSGSTDGVARAPCVLRAAGLPDILGQSFDVQDEGDVSYLPPVKKRDDYSGILAYESFVSMVDRVQAKVYEAFKQGLFPLVIGGDCPILVGCLKATRSKLGSLGLIFIDGHEDAYPPHKSPTGESADMELGFILGLNSERLSREIWNDSPLVDASRACLLGPRDYELLSRNGVKSLKENVACFYGYTDMVGRNIEVLAKSVIWEMKSKIDFGWLHIDLDVLSSTEFSAVDYPQPGGLKWEELEILTNAALSSQRMIGLNLTIYNPDLDKHHHYAKRIIRYLNRSIKSLVS